MTEPTKVPYMDVSSRLDAHERRKIEHNVRFETANIFRSMVKLGAVSNIIGAFLYVLTIYDASTSTLLLQWYGLLVAANFINIIWALHFQKRIMTLDLMSRCRKGFLYIIIVICLLWGSIGILFMLDAKQQTTTMIFLSAVLICFAFSTVTDLTMGIVSIFCLVVPTALYHLTVVILSYRWTGHFNSTHLSISAAFSVLGFFMIIACYAGNKVIIKMFRLGYENALLSQKLEGMNASLEERIAARTEELANLYSFTQATLESIKEGILAVGKDGKVISHNKNFLEQWHISTEFFNSETALVIFSHLAEQADNPVEFLQMMHDAQNNHLVNSTQEFRLKTGTIFEFYTRPQCLNGQTIGVVYSFLDITERHQLRVYATLQDRLATTGMLVASVAHEVNNPIAWILSNLQLVKQELETIDDSKEITLEDCRKSIANLGEIVAESITGAERIQEIVCLFNRFGRSDTDENEAINVHEILNAAINMASIEAKYHAVLEKDFSDELPMIKGSSNKLHQVFLNLLINAVQSLPEDPSKSLCITVKTAIEQDNMFRIDIKDTGHGIPQELQNRIFEPFFTTKPVGVGTGLGLSICHEIIRGFGGHITVDSVLEQGSTFSVHLPIAKEC